MGKINVFCCAVILAAVPTLPAQTATRGSASISLNDGPRIILRSSSGQVKVSNPQKAATVQVYPRGNEVRVRLAGSASTVRYDSRMIAAAEIAEKSARSHSVRSCWRYVKKALVEADLVDSYPKTAYAKEAARELVRDYGFTSIPVKDPFKAPVGSILVYGGRGAGHVEFRTEDGFVSDFASANPSHRPLIGVLVKRRGEG